MATLLITAATGGLGQATVNALLARGVAASSIAVAVRDPAKAKALGWEEKGISIRKVDYTDDQATWATALKGIERVLLISSNNMTSNDARSKEHKNVVEAFKSATSLKLVVYTSLFHADSSTMKLAEDHVITEKCIKETKKPYIFLRNGW